MKNFLAIDIKNQYFTGNPKANIVGSSPTSLFSTLIPNTIVFAGFIFLFFIVFTGFKMVTGAGSGQSPQEAAKTKAALTWSIVGFLIVVFSYSILEIVGAFLGIDFSTDWLARF